MGNLKSTGHKNLDVWSKSIQLVTIIYDLTNDFPKSEEFGLKSQIRRSAVSIPSNIAEGAGRMNKKEFIHFLYISLGSLSELDTQLIIAGNLKYINYMEDLSNTILSIKQMLNGLINSLYGGIKSKT